MKIKLLFWISVIILVLNSCSLNDFSSNPTVTPSNTNVNIPSTIKPIVIPKPISSIPFATKENYLGIWNGKDYSPVFIKGINLGAGVPGTGAGELAISADQYARWFKRMSEMGFNTLRIYTLHYPRFYDEFAKFNIANPDHPLYLLHGIWLDETESPDLYKKTDMFDEAIKELVDCVHGNRVINHRYGRAYGTYTTDISQWVMGWIVGREVLAEEVIFSDNLYSEKTSYQGQNFKISNATPSEAWFTERIDKLITYERETSKTERPVAVSSWPTLDPLFHKTEHHNKTQDDAVTIDITKIENINAKAGLFASYHIYPYHPNFMDDDPDYKTFSDEYGVNNYVGYLQDLKKHYKNIPLLVAEFGVPTSWLDAHYSPSGMDHGGHTEELQGFYNSRMLKNIYDNTYAGAILFAWMDEWWKRTWIVSRLQFPFERFPLWHNLASPEQNFGLIAFALPEPDFNKWQPVNGENHIKEIRAAYDAEYFHVKIQFDSLAKNDRIVIGYDTYGDDLGESVLLDETKTKNRSEFALDINVSDKAAFFVTEAYNLYYDGEAKPAAQLYRSVKSDGAPWILGRWITRYYYKTDYNEVFPATLFYFGNLKIQNESNPKTNLDAVTIKDNTVNIRIPWTYLQFCDPTTLSVISDDYKTSDIESETSEGIALSVVFKGELLETKRYKWDKWDKVPDTVEREKPSLPIFEKALKALPSNINLY